MTRRERRERWWEAQQHYQQWGKYAAQRNYRNMWDVETKEVRIVGKAASNWHRNNRLHGHPAFVNRSSRVRTL